MALAQMKGFGPANVEKANNRGRRPCLLDDTNDLLHTGTIALLPPEHPLLEPMSPKRMFPTYLCGDDNSL